MRVAKVKTESQPSKITVAITSPDKPEIPEEMQKKWQNIVDLAAKIVGVPSGLITCLQEEALEVFISSATEGNIFDPGLKLELGLGWYCENVAGTRGEMVVSNALKKDNWRENPSVPYKMISYMGIPILWPDGEVFGTFCMLDSKENLYTELFKELLKSLREIIQNDLKSVLLYQQAKDDLMKKEFQIREIHHRIKNHFHLLISSLSLQALQENDDRKIKSVIGDIQSRITAISLLHDKIHCAMDLEKISLVDYLTELGGYIIRNLSQPGVKYECDGPRINVPTPATVPCGLIVNELITNSLKYAFSDHPSPEIKITLEDAGDGELTLTYHDNGVGLPAGFDIKKIDSLGTIIIRQMVKQMEGTCRVSNNNGFEFHMKFRVPER